MAKGQSPLLGYNTNVRHRGRVFHIQTEDSGVQHPHVITHLFADGGRILKSTKTGYAELLETPDWQTQVKAIMQNQHKAMFIALRDGQFDALIDPNAAANPDSTGGRASLPGGSPSVPSPEPPPAAASDSGAARSTGQHPAAGTPARPAPQSAVRPAATVTSKEPAPVSRASTTIPAATAAAPAITVAAPADQSAASAGTGRYTAVRSPEILGSFKAKGEGGAGSIFGDGVMSEKSLDEVILAYLAEDLDEPKR